MAPREHYGEVEEFEGDVLNGHLADVLGRPKVEAPEPREDWSGWGMALAIVVLVASYCIASTDEFGWLERLGSSHPCRPDGGVACSEVSR